MFISSAVKQKHLCTSLDWTYASISKLKQVRFSQVPFPRTQQESKMLDGQLSSHTHNINTWHNPIQS